MGPRPEGCILARRDSKADFTPDNCYWEKLGRASRRYKAENRISYNGESLFLTEWAERTGLPVSRIWMRLNTLGWTTGQALGLEPRHVLPHKAVGPLDSRNADCLVRSRVDSHRTDPSTLGLP
jgi:hypothetical protein